MMTIQVPRRPRSSPPLSRDFIKQATRCLICALFTLILCLLPVLLKRWAVPEVRIGALASCQVNEPLLRSYLRTWTRDG